MAQEQRKDALEALDRLENDAVCYALCYRDGYGETRKDAETIRAALQSPRVPEPTSIENVAMEDTWLREKIGIALGEASMCWSEIPTGVFHSERATEILNDLCCKINTRKSPRVPVIEIPHEAIDNLYNSDMHWAMVSVSRQALDEILKFFYTYTETQEKIACDDAFKEVFKLLAEKVSLIQKKVKESNAD